MATYEIDHISGVPVKVEADDFSITEGHFVFVKNVANHNTRSVFAIATRQVETVREV